MFIPIAEETGSILEIGDWVLKTACREAATWTQPLTVAVNVSAVQIYNADFVRELHQTLLETGLPPRRLEIEITETALVRDFDRAIGTFRHLTHEGVAAETADAPARSQRPADCNAVQDDGSIRLLVTSR